MLNNIERKSIKIVVTVMILIVFVATMFPAFTMLKAVVGSCAIGWWTGGALAKIWSKK